MPIPPPPGAKKVFEGVLASVYQWPQKMYDGTVRTFECYTREDTVAVIPFLDADTLLLIKQTQPHLAEAFWDPPGGRVDPGETHEQAARREFQEETGYRIGRLIPWMHRQHKGMTRFEEVIYLATDLTEDPRGNHEDAGERITVVPVPWSDAVRMSLRSEMRRPDVMLSILGMEYDPEQRAKLEAFLSR